MSSLYVPSKNPKLVEAGVRGARRRWGDPRVVRLEALTPSQRRLVLALVDAAKAQNCAARVGTQAAPRDPIR